MNRLDIKLVIENIYRKKKDDIFEQDPDCIYDYSTYKLLNGIKDQSRYKFPLMTCEHKPYELSLEFLKDLSRTIIVLRNSRMNIKTIHDCIINFSKNQVYLGEIPEIYFTDPLITEYGDYTSFGILAILFGKFYENYEFKTKVENDLKRLGYHKCYLSRREVFMQENNTELSLVNTMINRDSVNILDNLFFWRDSFPSKYNKFN